MQHYVEGGECQSQYLSSISVDLIEHATATVTLIKHVSSAQFKDR